MFHRSKMNKHLAVILAVLTLVTVPAFAANPDGAAIFKASCAMCHGPDAAGQTPMGKTLKLKDLRSAEVQNKTDAQLIKTITDGKGKMPAFGAKKTPAEIAAVVAYLRTLKAK